MGEYVEAYKLVTIIEVCLHAFIIDRMKDSYGEDEKEWWTRHVGDNIRKDCAIRRELDPKRKDSYYYLNLIDLQTILNKNWTIFDEDFQRVSKDLKDQKKLFLDRLNRLNALRNEVMHPLRGETWDKDDFQFVRNFVGIVRRFAGEL